MTVTRLSAFLLLTLALPALAAEPNPGELFSGVKGRGTAGTKTEKIITFGKNTPAAEAAMTAAARKLFNETATRAKTRGRELQTDHVLVFTEAPAGEDAFIKKGVEEAYTAGAEAVGVAGGEKIYGGRIVVWVWARGKTFVDTAVDADAEIVSEDLRAYFGGDGGDGGHVGSWYEATAEGRAAWSQALRRDAVLAVLARYKSTRAVPAWLARGLAEMVGASERPDLAARDTARAAAAEKASLGPLFKEAAPGPEWYAVMQTLAEVLAGEPKKLAAVVGAIKDGTGAEPAIRREYGWDLGGLEREWRGYLGRAGE